MHVQTSSDFLTFSDLTIYIRATFCSLLKPAKTTLGIRDLWMLLFFSRSNCFWNFLLDGHSDLGQFFLLFFRPEFLSITKIMLCNLCWIVISSFFKFPSCLHKVLSCLFPNIIFIYTYILKKHYYFFNSGGLSKKLKKKYVGTLLQNKSKIL